MQDHRKDLFVGGAWVAPSSSASIDVENPATEQVVGSVPDGTPADVDSAVAAARAAFEGWAATPPADRAGLLARAADALEARADEVAALITAEVGMPLRLSQLIQARLPVGTFSSMAELASTYQWEEEVGNSLVLREPIGVVAAITPWNYPLHQIAAKVAPALAAGCTVVLKPSEVAPLDAFVLAEVLDSVGLPPGCFNLVTGTGPVVGEALASHPDVDMVSFTGSTRAGRRVCELAAATVKRVALELGGKSPNVLLDDADLAVAVKDGVAKAFLNSGQTCSALTRMLVPHERLAEAEEIAVVAAEAYTPGDPVGGGRLGPLVSARQRDRVRSYIEGAIDEGARLLTGGTEPPEGLGIGYYVRPTVLSGVTETMTVAREEVFGPVLAILSYSDEDDAVRLANATTYGLAAAVWSSSPERALRVARRLRAGQVDINGAAFNPLAPFGGYKQSGNGREYGRWGLEEFLEVKAVQR